MGTKGRKNVKKPKKQVLEKKAKEKGKDFYETMPG
jgi:hypothetical protein